MVELIVLPDNEFLSLDSIDLKFVHKHFSKLVPESFVRFCTCYLERFKFNLKQSGSIHGHQKLPK